MVEDAYELYKLSIPSRRVGDERMLLIPLRHQRVSIPSRRVGDDDDFIVPPPSVKFPSPQGGSETPKGYRKPRRVNFGAEINPEFQPAE